MASHITHSGHVPGVNERKLPEKFIARESDVAQLSNNEPLLDLMDGDQHLDSQNIDLLCAQHPAAAACFHIN